MAKTWSSAATNDRLASAIEEQRRLREETAWHLRIARAQATGWAQHIEEAKRQHREWKEARSRKKTGAG